MQTFLPLPDLRRSVACLDDRRLGKQRVEAFQILRVNRGITKGWRNHPAVLMWKGHEEALGYYMTLAIDEWVRRGFKNTMAREEPNNGYSLPDWFGNKDLHASHRSNLLRKDPEFYARYRWKEGPDLPYFWPIRRDEI